MNRTIELLRLVEVCGAIEGRKKLQKIVHLLNECGFAFPYRFSFHFHGPFSAELKGEIDTLTGQQLLKETESYVGISGFQQYKYSTTDEAKQLLSRVVDGDQDPAWSEVARVLNAKPAQELEAMSTIAFLRRHGYNGSALRERFTQLKPQLADQFESCADAVSALPAVAM